MLASEGFRDCPLGLCILGWDFERMVFMNWLGIRGKRFVCGFMVLVMAFGVAAALRVFGDYGYGVYSTYYVSVGYEDEYGPAPFVEGYYPYWDDYLGNYWYGPAEGYYGFDAYGSYYGAARSYRMPGDVIRIRTAGELMAISRGPMSADRYYVLENDIHLTHEWPGIVDFQGVFDGQGHTIHNIRGRGLFSSTTGATVKNVTVIIEDEQHVGSQGNQTFAGGLIHYAENTNVINAHVIGDVAAQHGSGLFIHGNHSAGGLIGNFSSTSENNYRIERSSAVGYVSATSGGGSIVVSGGLVGRVSVISGAITIVDSFSAGNVHGASGVGSGGIGMGPAPGNVSVGGLVGNISVSQEGNPVTIANSYSSSDVIISSNAFNSIGKLIGGASDSEILHLLRSFRLETQYLSVPSGGDFWTHPEPVINESGLLVTAGYMRSPMAGWDFDAVWEFRAGENNDFPVLQGQRAGGITPHPPSMRPIIARVDNFSFTNSSRYFHGYRYPQRSWTDGNDIVVVLNPQLQRGTIMRRNYLEILLDAPGMTNSHKEDIRWANSLGPWGGSCSGMAKIPILVMAGYLTPDFMQSTANNLYQVRPPNEFIGRTMDVIQYYQLFQSTAIFRNRTNRYRRMSYSDRLAAIVRDVRTSAYPVYIGFCLFRDRERTNRFGGHAVVGYAVYVGEFYYEIDIWDPNSLLVPRTTLFICRNYSYSRFAAGYNFPYFRLQASATIESGSFTNHNIQRNMTGNSRVENLITSFNDSLNEYMTELTINSNDFTITSSTGLSATISNGNKIGGSLAIGYPIAINTPDSELYLRFIVPNLSRGETYTVTIDESSSLLNVSLMYDNPNFGFLTRAEMHHSGNIIFSACGSIQIDMTSAASAMIGSTLNTDYNVLFTTSVYGTGRSLSINIENYGRKTVMSDSNYVDVRVSNAFDSAAFSDVEPSDITVMQNSNMVWIVNRYGDTLASRYIPGSTSQVDITIYKSEGGYVLGSGLHCINGDVILTARPDSGYVFAGWFEGSERVSVNTRYVFVATSNRTLYAIFIPTENSTLTATFTLPNPTHPITAQLRQNSPSGQIISTTTIPVTQANTTTPTTLTPTTLTLPNITPGTYSLILTQPGHTSFILNNIVVPPNSGNIDLTQDPRFPQHIPLLPGDVNGDGQVNISDLTILMRYWMGNYINANFTASGQINIVDLNLLMQNWMVTSTVID